MTSSTTSSPSNSNPHHHQNSPTSPKAQPQPQSQEEQEAFIKSNKSAAQQIIDLREELRQTQIVLRQREARLQAILNILTNINKMTESEVNKIHKHIQKNISQFTDLIGEPLEQAISQQLQTIDNISPAQMKQLSDQYRMQSHEPVLHIDGDEGASTGRGDNPKKNG